MANYKMVALPGIQEVVITHTFAAPAWLVFRAFTDPQFIPQWWGPRNLVTTIDQLDVRPGGLWRIVQRDQSGNEFAFQGVYHSVEADCRLVYTFEFEGETGHVILDTVTIEERNGKTKLTEQSVYQSVEDRDGMLNTGMEMGVSESDERLRELLAKLTAGK